MLIKTASPIESQTFSSWELAVRSALKNFHDGLNKVKCKDEPSQKIINHLISLVVKAENAVNTQQTNEKNQLIYTHLSQVHIELNEFVAHTKISHSEFDNYLIDAIRLFNHLTHPKYIEFFFEKNEIKLSKPINVKEKSKFLIKLIKITNDKVLPEFIRSTDSLPDTLYIDEPFIYFKSQEHEYSLLASQIGLTRYISSNQDPFILSLDDSERWTKRQISRITYDYYYTILFHLYNILNKINEISSNESNYETAEKKRNSLLRKLKLASLTSEEVKSYLNNVTKSLGFRSIESLYKNCIALRYQEGKKYFSKKSTFLNNEIAPKKLKKISKEELKRLRNAQPDLNNEGYFKIIEGFFVFSNHGIESCQHGIGKASEYSKAYIATQNQDSEINQKSDEILKNKLQDKFLFPLINEFHIQARYITNLSDILNDEWVRLRIIQTQNEQSNFKKVLMEVESSSDETITQNYINREIAYTDLFNERVKHSFDQAQNEQLDVVKKEYKDFKNAVQYYISKNAIDSKSINLFLEKQHELIAKVNTKIDSLREKIMLNQQNLEQYYKKNHSFLFFLKNKMYFIFNFFGYKTAEQISHEKYINEIKKSIASDKRDCEFAQKEFVFYHISKKLVEDQLSSYSLISQLNTEQLLNEVIERVSEHIDVYNRIRECYESSEASEDIGEQLHSLEVELLKTREVAEFSCHSLLSHLQHETEVSNIFNSNSPVKLKTLEDKLICLNHQISDYSKNENELIKSIESIIGVINQEIQSHLNQYEQSILSKLSSYTNSNINFLFKDKDIIDPISNLTKHLALDDFDFSDNFKSKIYQEIANRYKSFLTNEEDPLELHELIDIEFMIYKALYYHSTQISSPFLVETYKQILSDTKNLIDEKLSRSLLIDAHSFQEKLSVLDGLFIKLYTNQHQATQNKLKFYHLYQSWLNNPFCYISNHSILRDFEISEKASLTNFNNFIKRYLYVLQSYLKNSSSIWTQLDSHTLNAHAKRLTKEYRIIHESIIDNADFSNPYIQIIAQTQNSLIKMLNKSESLHPKNQMSSYDLIHQKVNDELYKLSTLSSKLEHQVLIDRTFDSDTFLEFITIIQDVKIDMHSLNLCVKAMKKVLDINSHDHLKWIYKIRLFENTLDFSKLTIDNYEKNEAQAFTLYSQVNLNSFVEIPSINIKYYGATLLLAIHHENFSLAFNIVLNHGMKIPIQYLYTALLLILETDQYELFLKIFHARKDISFNNFDLNNLIIKSAISRKVLFINEILLFSDVELKQDTFEFLLNSVLTENSPLPEVKSDFFKLIADEDGPFLEGVRQCYAVEYALLNHLNNEYNSIKIQTAIDVNHLTAFVLKIDRITSICEKMLSFYLRSHHFQDIERKMNHINIWSSYVNDLREKYSKGISSMMPSLTQFEAILSSRNNIMYTIEHTEYVNALFVHLQNLKNFFKNHDSQHFSYILSVAISHAVNHGKVEALDILLSYIEDPVLKDELSYNALCQAICSCEENCVKYLLSIEAYEFDRYNTLVQLDRLYHYVNQNDLMTDASKNVILQLLSCVPLPFDPIIIKLIDYVSEGSDTQISRLKQSFFQLHSNVEDTALQKIKNVYIFIEKAYPFMLDIYSDLRQPFEQILTIYHDDISEIDRAILLDYNMKLDEYIKLLHHQENVLDHLKKSYIRYVLNQHELSHKGKLKSQLDIWDDNLDVIKQSYQSIFDENLAFIKNILDSQLT